MWESVFWARIGNGARAWEFHLLTVAEAEKHGVSKVEQVLPRMVANACENLMFLSLAYEEYFAWADRLRKLQPAAAVLGGMVPHIKEAQERGLPWSLTFEGFAQQCYDRNDPGKDRGEYARAVSTYHLLLINRKAMRLPREAWTRITYEYGALALRVSDDAAKAMEHAREPMDPREFIFVVADAKPPVDECMAANPSDKQLQFLLEHMNGFLGAFSKRGR